MSDEMNLSGRLDQRMTLQQSVRTADGAGGASIVWQDIATIWAELRPARSSEQFLHDKLGLQKLHTIITRYRSDVTGDKQFVMGGRVFKIIGIMNIDEHKHVLEISVREEL